MNRYHQFDVQSKQDILLLENVVYPCSCLEKLRHPSTHTLSMLLHCLFAASLVWSRLGLVWSRLGLVLVSLGHVSVPYPVSRSRLPVPSPGPVSRFPIFRDVHCAPSEGNLVNAVFGIRPVPPFGAVRAARPAFFTVFVAWSLRLHQFSTTGNKWTELRDSDCGRADRCGLR